MGSMTLVLGDVVGSSRLWERHPDLMPMPLGSLADIVDAATEAHHGIRPLEQGEGDSFVVAFDQPIDAGSASLIGIDRWTPYELVQHMKRSTIHHIWPRAESKLYEEPKRLAAAGYVTATADRKDPRRIRYTISAAGRRLLSEWVAQPGSGVRFESEGAVKVLAAEHGTKDQLLATIDSIRRDALNDIERCCRVLSEIVTDGPPYPNRIHQGSLVVDLIVRLTESVVDWADSAEARVERWPAISPDERMRSDAMALVRDLRERAATILAAHAPETVDASA